MKSRLALSVVLACAMVGLTAARSAAVEPIHVRSVGTGKQCWVLLHPLTYSGRFWERRAPLLAEEHKARVYFPDLPSHGASGVARRFDYASAADAIQKALRADCPNPQLIVGASSGGIVAMKLGARTKAKVVGVGVGWSFSPANIQSLRDNAEHPSEALLTGMAQFAERGEGQVAALQRHWLDLAKLGTRPFLTPREARALQGRLLVLQGEKDDFFLRGTVDQLVDRVPGTTLHIFPGAGHLEPFAGANAPVTWALIDAFSSAPRKNR